MNKVPEKWLDSYEYNTLNEAALLTEIEEMELNSKWTPGIRSKDLVVGEIGSPIEAGSVSYDLKIPYELVYDTVMGGTKLLISNGDRKYGAPTWCIRDTARNSLYETAKLKGSSLGRMTQQNLSITLNKGLEVARGYTLMLERYGKVSAFHSDSSGGYRIMPISELLTIAKSELDSRFGGSVFVAGMNSHDYTQAVWELPYAKDDLLDVYQKAMVGAVSSCHTIDFMPAVRFASSDTASSSASLIPLFKLPSGTYFRLGDGIQVEHERTLRVGAIDGVELFEERAKDLFAQFNETADIIAKMSLTEIWNPVNTLVGICNKLKIPKKYADAAREEVERFCVTSRVMSMHDIYLSMAECVGYARQLNASKNVIFNLEESVAKALTLDWKTFDVGGIVAWGTAA